MDSAQEDEKSRLKVAQLWHIVYNTSNKTRNFYSRNQTINELLKSDFNINQKIKINTILKEDKEVDFNDYTALHFVYDDIRDIDTFNALLERGADFTIKNGNGQTVLHLIICKCSLLSIEKELPFINAVILAHIKLQNSANPQDNNGISHLHGACIANNVEAVELFLNNGASIDEAVSFDASDFAGFTSLHFASKFDSFEVVKLLVSRGININSETAGKKTALDLLVDNRISKLENLNISEVDEIIKFLLENSAVSSIGFSKLQVACMINNLELIELFLDQDVTVDVNYAVPLKLKTCSGDTALHFAAENSIEAMKILVKHGAKINVVNARGLTPVDVFMDKYNLEELCSILECIDNFNDILMSNGETKLIDLIKSMTYLKRFRSFLRKKIKNINIVIPYDSILWPGYSILHLAVIFSIKICFNKSYLERTYDKTIIKECLKQGLNLNAQDIQGRTAIHLAFIPGKSHIVKFLLNYLNEHENITNIADKDNLSYLYIACAMKEESLVEKLLKNSDPNVVYKGKRINHRLVEPGSTPLHAVTFSGSDKIILMLLKHGANLHAKDTNGMTPIHWLLTRYYETGDKVIKILLDSLLDNPKDCVVENSGLSYLHVACYFGYLEVVEKLLNLESDVNAIIRCKTEFEDNFTNSIVSSIVKFSNYSPLQLAIGNTEVNYRIGDLLLQRGADVFYRAEKIKIPKTIKIRNQIVLRRFFEILLARDDMQKNAEEKYGLTKLHIACFLKKVKVIRNELNEKVNVNAQINENAEIFTGCTPLHMLILPESTGIITAHSNFGGMISLLLDHQADVTIANAKKDTPIHVLYKRKNVIFCNDRCKELIFNAHRYFRNNPVNSDGVSHFHIAIKFQQVELVEMFLRYGLVDVNRPTGYFAKFDSGCTPLHLALVSEVWFQADWMKLSGIIDLLLSNGANVNAKDVYRETPLHKPLALKSPEMILLKKLVSYGSDIENKNVEGQTPIELCPDIFRNMTDPPENIIIFEQYGYKINYWNSFTGEGYIPKIFILTRRNLSQSVEFNEFLISSDLRTIENFGRNVLQNAVAFTTPLSTEEAANCIYAIKSIVNVGIDVNYQDNLGQTALHCAAKMENACGIDTLLSCGADVNIVDNSGKSAFSYATERCQSVIDTNYPKTKIVFRSYLMKLQRLRVEISKLNENLVEEMDNADKKKGFYHSDYLTAQFLEEIDMTENLAIGTKFLTIFDFLHETGALSLYPFWQKSERDLVVKDFNTIDLNQFKSIAGIITLQFEKLKARSNYLNSALSSLRVLLGFSFPGLCEQISYYLSNNDLKNLIEVTTADM